MKTSAPAPGFFPNLYMHTERRKTKRKGSEVAIIVQNKVVIFSLDPFM
jgi:hypothetical protein